MNKIPHFIHFRPGGFGARDYRNPTQLRNNRGGGGNRTGSAASSYSNHQPQQQWDGSNGGAGGNMWAGDHQAGGGFDRYSQQTGAGNGNRQQDHSWWDSTT